MLKLQRIELDQTDRFGEGAHGSIFSGKFNNKQIAVKRVQLIDTDEREEGALQKLDHLNVVKLNHIENHDTFKYFALELCSASLDQLFLDESHLKKYRGPQLPDNFTVLFQLASGLEHIHSKNLIHRDIKPENVLIHIDSVQKVTMKWADFGLSKPVNDRGTFTLSGLKGTNNWMAPELLKDAATRTRGNVTSDVFGEGLVFGYYLSNGKHPYGTVVWEIPSNIVANNPVNIDEIQSSFARELIQKMLESDFKKRITSLEVVQHLQSIKIETNTIAGAPGNDKYLL
uniref:Protein kinase domain-containing protein n=1 Tax=Daphnia galeata TaxID=27404 RepID=A0A8J2RPK8_9CRUS|nr:unnamed protein product [Daphnia galeata]